MFHHHEKKRESLAAVAIKDLTRIVPAEVLLGDEKRSLLLCQIRQTMSLDDKRYKFICDSLIHHLANYCQSLPETATQYYSYQGGLLDNVLNRTEAALTLFIEYLVSESGGVVTVDSLSSAQSLWQYALFSAAILQGIGKLYVDYQLSLYDLKVGYLDEWNPLLTNLVESGSYYRYDFKKDSSAAFRARINLLLARSLMPKSGFAWIASNSEVLAVWLALLNEDYQAAGTLGAILVRATALSIQRNFNQKILISQGKGNKRYHRTSTFAHVVPESITSKEQLMGIEFIQWLMRALESGNVLIDKSFVFSISGSLWMSGEIFKLFVRENPMFKNWQAVQNGFLSLGLHNEAADGSVYKCLEVMASMQEGLLLSDFAVALPGDLQVYNAKENKLVALTATDLIYNSLVGNNTNLQKTPHLTASGSWEVISSVNASLKQQRI